ncbi:MAG: FMN-binding negative transcriptional regulator [Propionibacteriaceae bacterium]|jgi:transcriptional regulator|nr:FMN-binding negative transcriptional regulator [Propionibacteriaceae bacterium]
MYVAAAYRMAPDDVARQLAAARSGNLVTIDPDHDWPVATLLPWTFLPDPDRLISHVSRVNPQWRHTTKTALVILDQWQAPVGSQWQTAAAQGQAVPTLNYETIHVWGDLTADDSEAAVMTSWEQMLRAHDSDVQLADLDPDYLSRQARATVALTLTITAIEAKSKLSQTESSTDLSRLADDSATGCPVLSQRLREVSLPYVTRREAAVAAARLSRSTPEPG